MIVLLAVGVRRVALPLSRHQDREQQPVRPRQHKPQGVQEGPKAGETSKLLLRQVWLKSSAQNIVFR